MLTSTLIKAIQEKDIPLIIEILSFFEKEDFKIADKDGERLLHYIAKYGHIEITEMLFKYYEEFTTVELAALKNNYSENPLHFLVRYQQNILTMIPAGFKSRAITAWINQANDQGNTPLHLAILLGFSDKISQLLEMGKGYIDVNARNFLGYTPLHLAAQKKYLCIAEVLIKCKSDAAIQDNEGNTALHLAAADLDNLIFDLLLKEGASISITSNDNKTPINIRIDSMKQQGTRQTILLAGISSSCPVSTCLTFSSLPYVANTFDVPKYVIYIVIALGLLSAFAVIWGKYESNIIKYGKNAQQSLQLQANKIDIESMLKQLKEFETIFKSETDLTSPVNVTHKINELSRRFRYALNYYFTLGNFKKSPLMREPTDWATKRDRLCAVANTTGGFLCAYGGILAISAFIEQADFSKDFFSTIPADIRTYTDPTYAILVALAIIRFSSIKSYRNSLLTFGLKHLAFYRAQEDLLLLQDKVKSASKKMRTFEQDSQLQILQETSIPLEKPIPTFSSSILVNSEPSELIDLTYSSPSSSLNNAQAANARAAKFSTLSFNKDDSKFEGSTSNSICYEPSVNDVMVNEDDFTLLTNNDSVVINVDDAYTPFWKTKGASKSSFNTSSKTKNSNHQAKSHSEQSWLIPKNGMI